MRTKIQLDSIEAVKNFVNTVALFPGDIDLSSGRYTVDAKSIMGIFSLDLSQPIEVFTPDEEQGKKLLEKIRDYIVE